jgi:hypothetical protein
MSLGVFHYMLWVTDFAIDIKCGVFMLAYAPPLCCINFVSKLFSGWTLEEWYGVEEAKQVRKRVPIYLIYSSVGACIFLTHIFYTIVGWITLAFLAWFFAPLILWVLGLLGVLKLVRGQK